MDHLKPHIIEKFQRGSESALGNIFRALNKHFFHQAYAMVGTKSDAEELVSDAFMKLWHKREGLSEGAAIFKFLERTIYYGSLHVLQRRSLEQSRQTELQDAQTEEGIRIDLETAHVRAEMMADVMAEIEKLSDRRKTIMKMILSDLSEDQIAQQLGISIRTVYNTKFSAMESLRVTLGKDIGSIAVLIYLISKHHTIN